MSQELQIGSLVYFRHANAVGGHSISRGRLIGLEPHRCVICPEITQQPQDPYAFPPPPPPPLVYIPTKDVAPRLEQLVQRLQIRQALGRPTQLPPSTDS